MSNQSISAFIPKQRSSYKKSDETRKLVLTRNKRKQ